MEKKNAGDSKKKKKYEAYLQVLGYFIRDNRASFFCLTFAAVAEALTPFIVMILMGKLLDAVREGADFRLLVSYILGALGAQFFLQVVSSAARQYYNRKYEYMHEIENAWLNRKAFEMDYEYLEDTYVQELRTRGDFAWSGVIGWGLYQFETCLSAAIAVLAAIVIVIPLLVGRTAGKFSAASLVLTTFMILVIGILMAYNYRKNSIYSREIQEIYDGTTGMGNRAVYYQDILATAEGQKDLRIYGQQEAILADVHRIWIYFLQECQKVIRICMKMTGVNQTTVDLSGLMVYVLTSAQAFLGVITVGQVVTCSASIIRLTTSVTQFAVQMGYMERISMLCQAQKEYMDLQKRKHEGTIPMEKRRDNKFKVQFEHVSFRYPGTDRDVIKDLNLEFVIGERMAIVGKNGSGKTTFIKLLCRLYDVTEGCIKVNGIDIRKYDYKEYCRLFSVVFQDFCIFSLPVGENIAGRGMVDRERAVDALSRVGLGERVLALPEGLDTYAGRDFAESGVIFSGGEKQKMAIARAIYKDAPFVIMDEPTAALDPELECEVYAGFDKTVGNKTALYISHRLASCRFCQDILVFEEGKVVQHGSHEELERQNGLYRELWNAQAQYYNESENSNICS